MNKINIPFRGMTNVPDDSFSQDGSMGVLLNMRHKGGELVECKKPQYEDAPKVENALYHAQSEMWLELLENGKLQFGNRTGGGEFEGPYKSFAIMGNLVIMYGEHSVHYAIWRGEENDNKGAYVFLGALPEIPSVEFNTNAKLIKLETSVEYRAEASLGLGEVDSDASAEKVDSIWFYAESAYAAGVLDKAYQKGMFVDRALFRLAFKLFDGSYINPSQVYMVENNETFKTNVSGSGDDGSGNTKLVGKDHLNLISDVGGDGGGRNLHQMLLNAFEVDCSIGIIPEKWKDIIVSVEVFTSGSIMGKKMVEEFVPLKDEKDEIILKGSRKAERWVTKPGDELVRDIVNCNTYYRYASFDLNGKLLDKVDNTSPSMLAQGDSLTEWTRHELISEKTAVYNSRLHAMGNKRGLFPGYRDYKIPGDDRIDVVDILTVKVDIRTEEGMKEVVTTLNDVMLSARGDNDDIVVFPGLLMYPDCRAEKMTIYLQQEDKKRYKEFLLTKHDSLDLAYYMEKENRGNEYAVRWFRTTRAHIADIKDANKLISELMKVTGEELNTGAEETYVFKVESSTPESATATLEYKKADGTDGSKSVDWNSGEEFGLRFFPQINLAGKYQGNIRFSFEKISSAEMEIISEIRVDESWIPEEPFNFPVPKTDAEKVGDGVMRVSAVDNPFYYPTAQTYKFEGDIIGLASNAEAISTGQFGAYPLFVFTKEGVWAMQVDTSGEGAYVSQSPFSREICSGAICPVSGGVVFTTLRGLMAISGGQVAELSKQLDGLEEPVFDYSGTLVDAIFERAGYDHTKFEPVPIREYIQGESGKVKGESGAKLAYNYLHNEVILSNNKYGYSYVYNLDDQTWSIIDTTFDVTTNSYPELVVYNNTDGKRYTFNDSSTGAVPVVAITRPFTLGSLDYKRLRQAALRCTFGGGLNFYLLGSNDGASFVCITGKENGNVETHRDLVTSMSRSKQYKYFAIAIAGQMNGRVSLAELLVDAGFAVNKLR